MFLNEAHWILNEIENISKSEIVFPILNIGSSTLSARNASGMQKMLYDQLEVIGKIIHVDIQSGEGVDMVGDLMDESFIQKLQAVEFNMILCSNLLEHVVDPDRICDSLLQISKPGGYLIITIPFRYPYHYDPIDTMLRPTPEKLYKMFPSTDLISKSIIADDRTYFDMLKKNKKLSRLILFRSLLPFYKPKMWWNTVRYLPSMFKKFQVSCIVIKKNDENPACNTRSC